MHCFPSLTQPQLTFYGSKDQVGSFWTVVRAGRMGGSSIRLTHECVSGYFGFLNRAKAECGPGWAFSHVYLCMYEHVCMREEAFQEKLSGRLPLTAIHRQIQNTKQQLLQSEAWGGPPASAQLLQLPHLLQKHQSVLGLWMGAEQGLRPWS